MHNPETFRWWPRPRHESQLQELTERIERMAVELDALNANVAALGVASAAVLAEIAKLKSGQGIDPVAVQAAADQVAKIAADLQAAAPPV